MASEVYQMKVGWCVLLWYKYITLYRGLERCRVKNIQHLGCGRVKLLVKNLIIIRVLHSDPCVILS